MSWNHRVLAHEHKGEIYFQMHEVYYDKEGVLNSYTANPVTVGGESIESIKWTLDEMAKAREKPILLIDGFPNEYKP